MPRRSKKLRNPKDEYLEKARALSREDAERLFARMGGKLTRRLEDKRLSALEVVALQLELEDEDLKAWRKNFAEVRKKHKD